MAGLSAVANKQVNDNQEVAIEITTTAYGRPAIDLLASQLIALKDGDPLKPVTVIVRSNSVSVSTRRALAARPEGIANVNFVTLRRLAEQIGSATLAQSGRRPLSAPLVTSAIRAVLTDAPGIFAPVAEHPATEQALAVTYRELRTAPDTCLDAVAGISTTTSDVVRIFHLVRERLSSEWYDEEDLLTAAAHIARSGGAALVSTVLHLLPTLTAGEVALVRALANHAQLFVNVGFTGDAEVDNATVAEYGRADIIVPADTDVEPSLAGGIVSTSDPDDEVRAAMRTIEGWMRDGIRLGRTAILYPTADPYARLLHEKLAAAGIPFNGTPVHNIGSMLYGRAIRRLLSLPDNCFRRQDVLGLVADAVNFDGSKTVPSRSWERISRAARIVSGDDWQQRLPQWADAQRREATRFAEDGHNARADHCRREADRAETLATFVGRLRKDLDRGSGGQSWTESVAWLKAVAAKYIGDERRRSTWPEDEWQAARRVEDLLDRLRGLDALPGPPPSISVFRQTLASELEVVLGRTGRSGEGVLVGHVSMAAGMVFERVLVLGMSEGRFPPRRLEDALLPDAARAAAEGHLQLRAHRQLEDRRNLLAAVAGADQAVLSHPRGDLRRSTEQPASRWLLADAARLAGVERLKSSDLRRRKTEPWLAYIPSFAAGLANSIDYPTDQDLRMAAVARQALSHPLLLEDGRVCAALDVVRARRSNEFTRFDGNLAGVGAELLVPTSQISATALESWVKCPRAYLFGRVLGVERVEEPERRFEIDPATRGSVVHAILEEFVRTAIDEKHSFDGWTPHDHRRLQRIAANRFDEAEREGKIGHAMLWRAERTSIAKELDQLLTKDSQRLADGFQPIAAEFAFDNVAISLPSGHVVRMRGSIDRIDRGVDGELVVMDYKTGGASTYKKLCEDDPHDGGRRLQLYVYARAAMNEYSHASKLSSYYYFTKDAKCYGYAITDQVAHLVLDALDQITTGIREGVFPAHPSDQAAWRWVDCWFCTPDGLSDQFVRLAWERKHDDPALAGYLSLTEPGEADDLD
ncbi:PD-(D/E)XK nuclease family protein [Mycobacterium bourgelatii]|uniref:PD-(D/E)XK endonuclease-like domain-containing protein n=1 Tax=Mycobacterium bourgelatii TaxID=1273442 RepID=A0A7I9YSA6_MYCBU|nr:PD-(D/E)XK nuclease family protein [Mycobacterium bourgelatii]MCV6978592.1 PD-(D/E)XK nuclease family protein [Mycobacterium bourgelatii]GFG91412.1 hypothetical protein MBOU_34540 [Mycobacterium bourgelatii]